ncbi:MAG: hypothetical protein ACRCZZ_05280, partial [Phocaeicola sp.]
TWRLPTASENETYTDIRYRSKWTCIDDIYGCYFGPEASWEGTDGEFLPGVGYRQNADGSLKNPKIHGKYWSGTKFPFGAIPNGYMLELDGEVVRTNYPEYQASGLSVRCVKQ